MLKICKQDSGAEKEKERLTNHSFCIFLHFMNRWRCRIKTIKESCFTQAFNSRRWIVLYQSIKIEDYGIEDLQFVRTGLWKLKWKPRLSKWMAMKWQEFCGRISKEILLQPYIDLKTEYFDLGLPEREKTKKIRWQWMRHWPIRNMGSV